MYKIARIPEDRYCSYFDYALQLRGEGASLCGECMYTPAGQIAKDVTVTFHKQDCVLTYADFGIVATEYQRAWNGADCALNIKLMEGPGNLPSAEIRMIVSQNGIRISTDVEKSGFTAVISGGLQFGQGDSVSAVSLDRTGSNLRSSYGPATSVIDDALFDREADRALRLLSDSCRIKYDFRKQQYCFRARNHLSLWVEEHVFASRFSVKYKGINKKNTFPTPPAGWMTWYAVKFDACEEAVVQNAKKQKELFGDYGANTIWVDWEWYHSGFDVEEGVPGIHYFSPDPVRYPNGLKYVSDKIREQGFIPALWVGPTNEQILTDDMQKNEHFVYADHVSWCGRYYFDLTNETYRKEFIPSAFRQVKAWGYEALKWDCLPISLEYADRFHENLTDPSVTSEQALRRVIQTARDTLGEDFYMLSCAGEWDRAVLFASDIFDGARIGGDIFSWEEFRRNFLERIMRFYSLHNNVFYCDPDNLVIRPEFNDYDQAVTRTSMISLLGLPLTLGDDLRVLPEERVELIRRALPPLDIRPMDIRESGEIGESVIVNLGIAKAFEEWNVVQVVNLKTQERTITVDFDGELHLDEGSYLVYDYWRKEFLGKLAGSVTLTLPACGSAVLSIRKYTGKQQIVSTSRHISQGGFDLMDVWLDKEGQLCGRSKVVAGEPYVITAYDPETQEIFCETIHPESTGEVEWSMRRQGEKSNDMKSSR